MEVAHEIEGRAYIGLSIEICLLLFDELPEFLFKALSQHGQFHIKDAQSLLRLSSGDRVGSHKFEGCLNILSGRLRDVELQVGGEEGRFRVLAEKIHERADLSLHRGNNAGVDWLQILQEDLF